jgi:uncharacterized SAM-binding protein YcdF (DUF218 family)
MDFVTFSKLLPPLFYPLGLACLLLSVAWFGSWKQSSWVQIPLALALGILLLASNGWLSNTLLQSLERQNLPLKQLPTADAIVLLGGSTKSAVAPRVMVEIGEQGDRVLYAAKLYQEQKAPLILASGGRIEWLTGGQAEAADMAELLQLMGVPAAAIIQEPNSLNTYENAVEVKKILEKQGIKRALLVTSALHMPRALKVFRHQKIDAIPAPTDFLVSDLDARAPNRSLQSIILNFLPDAGHLAQTTQALKEYIGLVAYRLQGWL